jgi:SAM-dependent methyltransferase
MLDFDMGESYDAVVCLFSSIGYLKTKKNLVKAVTNFARHTKPGGVVIVEPWIKASDFIEAHIAMEASNSSSSMSVSRMGLITREGNITTLNLHYMVGTANGINHFVEAHQLAMYSDEDFIYAFVEAGLSIDIDPVGLTGRRLCVGSKPL